MDTTVVTTTSPAMGLIATLFVGLIIGFIANSIMGAGGLGLVWSIVLGLIGSLVGGFVFSLLGVAGGGLLWQILMGVVGACLILFAAKKLRHA